MLLRCFFYINTELLPTPQTLRFSHRDKREARVTGDETQGTRMNAKAPACPFSPSCLWRAQIFIDRGYRKQRVRLAIRWFRVRVLLWELAGFVLGSSELKSSVTLVISQFVAFCQLGYLILLCCNRVKSEGLHNIYSLLKQNIKSCYDKRQRQREG